MSDTDRITELEIRFSEQQKTIDDLNEVVLEQGKRIDLLESRLTMLKAKLDAFAEPGLVDPRASEKPPHY